MSSRRPIGGGGAGNPASLANLKRGEQPAPTGNRRALRHGGYSEALVADVSAEVRELMDALGDAAPVRDPDGSLPAADVVAVERAARLLRRYRKLEAWLDLYGELDERTGEVKPAARLAGEVGTSLDRALDALGMTPTSRGKLGLDLARTVDLAQEWARESGDAAGDGDAQRDAGGDESGSQDPGPDIVGGNGAEDVAAAAHLALGPADGRRGELEHEVDGGRHDEPDDHPENDLHGGSNTEGAKR